MQTTNIISPMLSIYSSLFYRHNSQFQPRINLGFEKIILQKITAGTNVSYGGYNKVSMGEVMSLTNLKP